jgi:hypothetical protein
MLDAIGGALEGVVAGIGADLAAAAESGDSGQFQVDLEALHNYYYKVFDIWSQLNQHANKLPADPFSSACINTGQIPGVTAAIEATVNGALSTSEASMRRSLEDVRGKLAEHLIALHDVYCAYVRSDSQGASELTQAGNARAANIKINLPDPSSVLGAEIGAVVAAVGLI